MKRSLESLTEAEFNSLKASGLLWEIYPDAQDTWVANMEGLKVKHTAGPWNWIEEDWMIRASNGEEIATVEAIMVLERGMDSCLAEQSANAVLMASAPELLEALKHSKKVFECTGLEGEADNLSIIIAKAEGRTA